jgi:hypothetical protein
MTRTILSGILAVLSVAAIGALPLACQSGGVGDPCTPEDEYNPQFAGFKVTEENIESRSFQCQTRICLVNHFQGRTSCPLGQEAPTSCSTPGEKCASGGTCSQAGTFAPDCDPSAPDGGQAACAAYGGKCNKQGKFCECTAVPCPTGFTCDAKTKQCTAYVCHTPNACQTTEGGDSNKGKDCCIPGTDTPVVASVCGQCDAKRKRDAVDAVYCSCRCGVADGEPDDPNFNFCACPNGFECAQIRRDVGISDKQITGKYCIKTGSTYTSKADCGSVKGYWDPSCDGAESANLN